MEIEINDSTIDSFIIEGLSKTTPLIDIFVLLTKQLKGIKKITVAHDPINYISDDCKCQVDFINHEYYTMAKSILKSPNLLNNLFNENKKQIKIKECKKFRNNLIDDTVNKTTALMFENMQIDQTNIFEFIKYLKEYITNNASNGNNSNNNDTESNNYKILKIRQYNNRVLVIFDYVPNCIKKLIRKGENEYSEEIPYFNYKEKNIPVIPKMKPVNNLGKYKEKNVKISIHCLNQEDKENLFKIFEKNNNDDEISEENDLIDKMAEKAYSNVMNKERNIRDDKFKKNIMNRKREREREKEKSNERDNKEKERQRDKDRNRDTDKNRDRKREREKDRERKKEKEKDYERRHKKEKEGNSHERKIDNNNNKYKNTNNNNLRGDDNNNNNLGNNINNINNVNNINNINNNNLNGLNINEKDLNQVASLFSNTNAMNLVKYLIENNMFNSISNLNNNNNNNMMPKKDNNNIMKNNYNDTFNNIYNQNNVNNINNQQLLNFIQSQGNLMNKQNPPPQRMNNMIGNNMNNNNIQNMMNLNSIMNTDNNMLNPNYFNNQRQFPFQINEQFMNQFGYNQPIKRKDNDFK